ncbi:hypothetical protein [Synechococcus elongatus]
MPFLAGIAVLVISLCWSAAIEMGTRWLGQRSQDRRPPESNSGSH